MLRLIAPQRRTRQVLLLAYALGSVALVVVLVFVRDWMLLSAILTFALLVLGRVLWKLQQLQVDRQASQRAAVAAVDVSGAINRLPAPNTRISEEERRRRFRNGLRLASDLFRFKRAAIFVFDPVMDKLHAAANHPDGFIPTPSEAARECARRGCAVRAGRPGASELAVPLMAGKRVLGVIWAASEAPADASAERMLEASAKVFATILDSVREAEPVALDDVLDLFERREKNALAQSGFYRSVIESMHEGVIVADADGTVTLANPCALRILGLKEEVMLGRHFLDLLESHRGWTPQEVHDSLRDAFASGRSFEREVMIRVEPPTYYQLRVAAIRGVDSPDENLGFFAVLSDVTKLRQSDQVKSDVMSLVSHELRTPLTAIRGYSELLGEMQDLSPTARQCVETINEASQRMSRMLSTFLDVARLESGKQKIEKYPLRLNEVVRDAIYLILPLAEERQIDIVDDCPQSVPVVPADRDLMVQVMTNLLSNAIKYSKPGTSVRISMEIGQDRIKVMVADQGLGIPADSLPRIWDKFYRVERELEGSTVGSGLGLNFVREIVHQHGGEVDVVSQVGLGSLFSFCLPRL